MSDQGGLGPRLKKIYPRIWPVVFGLGGILMLSGTHFEFQIFGLNVNSHILMWLFMALAHADCFWDRNH